MEAEAISAWCKRAEGVIPDRRFPAPGLVDEENAACFIVRDRDGNSLADVYFEDEPAGDRPQTS
jgi:hypothetical protein